MLATEVEIMVFFVVQQRSQEAGASGDDDDSDADSDGYGEEGLSWEAVMESLEVRGLVWGLVVASAFVGSLNMC